VDVLVQYFIGSLAGETGSSTVILNHKEMNWGSLKLTENPKWRGMGFVSATHNSIILSGSQFPHCVLRRGSKLMIWCP
jgi:hypothetical protein